MAAADNSSHSGKHSGGRPLKFTDKEIAEIASDFQDYILRTEDPTLVGFTSYYDKYHVLASYMSVHEEFSNLIKQAIEKQEAYLMDGAVKNKLNATFAIFRLKQPQHGWTDRIQQDLTTNGKDLPTPILGNMNVLSDNSDTQNLIP